MNGNPVVSEVVAQTGMNDYRRIRTLPAYRRLKPSETRQLHAQSLKWLEDQTTGLKGKKVVIVTHRVPSPQSIPSTLAGDAFNPAFASDLSRFVAQSEARLWVHGHMHQCCDYLLGKTRVLANPRGYPTELKTGFNPELVVEV